MERQLALFATNVDENDLPWEEAKLITADDATRILCGTPRAVVLEERKAKLAGQQPDQAPIVTRSMECSTEFTKASTKPVWLVNLTDAPVTIKTDRYLLTLCPRDAVLTLHGEHLLDEAQCLRRADTVLESIRSGEVELDDRLRLALAGCS